MIIITSITAFKDGFEDFKRHATDKTLNNRTTQTLGNWENVNSFDSSKTFFGYIKRCFGFDRTVSDGIEGAHWKDTLWKDVQVGDFLRLKEGDFIPADLIILSTSESNSLCYVETKNLDGETNLKIRQAVPETSDLQTPEDCAKVEFQVESEHPKADLINHNAKLTWSDKRQTPINLNTMLLRGCVLKNTEWVIGLVIFTGKDTKLALNSGKTPSKRSQIEKQMNIQVLVNLVIVAMMCIACAIGTKLWEQYYADRGDIAPFLGAQTLKENSTSTEAMISFWNGLITFQNIVPISLYLSIEFIKSVQAYFIYADNEMTYQGTSTIPKNWNLSDDLGQIEYIFSDKTGTLTKNVMEFRKCSINGKKYAGDSIDDSQSTSDPVSSSSSQVPSEPSSSDNSTKKKRDSKNSKKINKKPETRHFGDKNLIADLNSGHSEHTSMIDEFFTLLAICHTVLVSTNEEGEQQYKAQSPDEAALVKAAKDVGYTFVARDLNNITIVTPDGEKQFELLNVLEFNSTRKRMSIIVREPQHGKIKLYCKGADNIIFERLKLGQDYMITGEHLQEFANEGLRTLCLAVRDIDASYYEEWNADFKEAIVSTTNRDSRVAAVSERIERDLVLLGATAIEDRLQDGVPECIATLKRAGIKIWVLTGDKLETAISIGFATCLLSHDMNLIVIREGSRGKPNDIGVYEQLRNAAEFFRDDPEIQKNLEEMEAPESAESTGTPRPSLSNYRTTSMGADSLFSMPTSPRTGGYALVIDGVALKHALEKWRPLLLNLACKCKGVVCCRVSPLQKAEVVKLVKHGKDVLTCAIGDGANDVSMIQAAHVGIGVVGEEGLQAVMSSDYAIAQFRFLTRLLLVHGHYAYIRNSSMIVNFFYKNMIGVGVLFWFQFFCGYTTTTIFEFTYILFWNLFFTSTPIFAIGIFDRDVPDRVAVQVPELYRWGMEEKSFTLARFIMYMLDSVYQSLICFFVPYFAYRLGSVNTYGRQPDLLEMGTTMAVACVTQANLFVGFNFKNWTVPHLITVWGSIALMYVYVAIYSLLPFSLVYGYDQVVYGGATFWACIMLIIVMAFLPRYVYRYYQRTCYPRDVDIIRELVKIEPPNHNFSNDSRVNPTLNMTRSPTSDTIISSLRPPQSDSITFTPRPSFTTDRTMQNLSLTPDSPIQSEFPVQDIQEGSCMVANMQTGEVITMRGYAFAQEAGTGRMIMGTLRRRKTNPALATRETVVKPSQLRRRSLPDVRASKDMTDVSDVSDVEKIRMVTFTESATSSTTATAYSSRRQSELASESLSLEELSGAQSETTGVTERSGIVNNVDIEARVLNSVVENISNEDNVLIEVVDGTSNDDDISSRTMEDGNNAVNRESNV